MLHHRPARPRGSRRLGAISEGEESQGVPWLLLAGFEHDEEMKAIKAGYEYRLDIDCIIVAHNAASGLGRRPCQASQQKPDSHAVRMSSWVEQGFRQSPQSRSQAEALEALSIGRLELLGAPHHQPRWPMGLGRLSIPLHPPPPLSTPLRSQLDQ
ncbi:hypothetical protein ACJZ2D_003597 [Fusarium nematophilum]